MTIYFQEADFCKTCNNKSKLDWPICSPYAIDNKQCPCNSCILKIICKEGCDKYFEHYNKTNTVLDKLYPLPDIDRSCRAPGLLRIVDFDASNNRFYPEDLAKDNTIVKIIRYNKQKTFRFYLLQLERTDNGKYRDSKGRRI